MKGIPLVALILLRATISSSQNLNLTDISSGNSLPNGECFVKNVICETHDNLLSVTSNVATINECRNTCNEFSNCRFLTYYGPKGAPFEQTCFVFSQCDTLNVATGSVTEGRTCTELCSKPKYGHIGTNLLDYLPDIASEEECQLKCRDIGTCTFYTFYKSSRDFIPNSCILQSKWLDPVENCEECATGFGYCLDIEEVPPCRFNVSYSDESLSNLKSYLFKDKATVYFDPLLSSPFHPNNCRIKIIGIGGGGTGRKYPWYGGGSGYVRETLVTINSSTYIINVGKPEKDSSVVEAFSGVTVLVAEKGESPTDSRGGAGYSGGSSRGNTGGSNGSDGDRGGDGEGGQGSGVDVSQIKLSKFVLTPAYGGSGRFGRSEYGAGGGGGVKINGEGDYGSGGSNGGQGNAGAVIIEVY